MLEPGFGLAAWLRLSRGADLTGGVGPLDEEEEEAWPKWSLADVASHTTPEDSWMAVRGKVYNVSPYLRYHPGGGRTRFSTRPARTPQPSSNSTTLG